MKILFTMRTSDRSPKTNYLGQTIGSLLGGGMEPSAIRVVPSDPGEIDWIPNDLKPYITSVHPLRRTPNGNGLALIELLNQSDADWIVLSEDDLEWCYDPIGSMTRWLEAYAQPDVLVYRFFAFDALVKVNQHVARAALKEMKGSQAVAMRAADARRFERWARSHPTDWRPKGAPFQDQPRTGFDKLIGYWALQDRPDVPYGLVSRPFFVRHLGVQSSLHAYGRRMDQQFAGTSWSFREKVCA